MTKKETAKKKPSRVKYEKEHPTLSFRVDKETFRNLTGHLQSSGASFADFVKDSLEKEQKKVAERVEILASQKIGSMIEERLKTLRILLNGLITAMSIVSGDNFTYEIRCPQCPDVPLSPYVGKDPSTGRYTVVWACLTCNFVTRGHEPIGTETLFPFPAENLRSFLEGTYDVEELISSLKQSKIKFPRPKLMQKAGKSAG